MAATAVRVSLLGPVQCRRDGVVVPLGGARRSALLALLAARQPHPVSRAELVDGLWGNDPPLTVVNSIQVHVSAVRRALGKGAILSHGDGYRLAELASVDAADFNRELAKGQAELSLGEVHAAARTLRAALALWQGPALADVLDTPFAAIEATRLEELRLGALSARIEADLALGRHHEVVPELRAVVAQAPLREELREALVRALDRCGRRAEALAACDEWRRLLRDELGLDPSPAMRALHQQLLRLPDESATDWAGSGVEFPRVLPSLLDETVGRDEDLHALETLLAADSARLVTVLGPGGVGKTRLSIELAHRVGPRFRDGVVFVPLVEAEKPEDVAVTICTALGIPAADDAEAALRSALPARQLLLVCDNFEHVVAAATTITSLLRVAPGLQVLTTSRQPLNVQGERRYRLDPLRAADSAAVPSSPAVDLFVMRARAVDPEFDPAGDHLSTVRAICDRCDGLPLAIELAAARVHVLAPAELLERMHDPVAQPSSSSAGVRERHRSVRASIAWSFEGLPSAVRETVPLLSVFRGGFTVAAAGAVAGLEADEGLLHVQTLLDHSLLRRSLVSPDGHRFELLETIRQYGRSLVSEDDLARARDRHARYYRTWMSPPADTSPTPSTAAAWSAQLVERPNIRAAARWALGRSDGELAADLTIGAISMWHSMGPRDELAEWLAAVLRRADVSTGRRADAFLATAFYRERAGDVVGLGETLDQARQLAVRVGDDRRLAWVTIFSAWHATLVGDRSQAQLLAARAAALAERHPEAVELTAWTLLGRGLATSDTTVAIGHIEHGLQYARMHGLDVTALLLLANLTELTLVADRPERARRLADEGIPLARTLGAVEQAGVLQCLRAYANLQLGDDRAAAADALAAMRHAATLADPVLTQQSLRFLAAVTAADRPERAAHLLGIADGCRPTRGEQPAVEHATERYLVSLPERLGAAFAPAHDSGRQLVAENGLVAALVTSVDQYSTDAPETGRD